MSKMKKQTEQELEPVGELLKRVKRINKFGSEYGVLPSEEVREVCQGMYSLANSLPEIEVPKNQDELLRAEAKRRLSGEASYLEQRLGEGSYTFDDVLNILGIPRSDVDALRPWLEANKEKTQGAVDRLFHSRELEEYKLPLKLDIPNVRRQSEEFAAVNVDRYHNIFGKFLESLTKVGGFLRDIKATVTTENRSYFSTLDRTLAIGLPAICFSKEDGTLDVKERELIRLYGHEGMGHALNQVVTQAGGLPYFSTRDSELTLSTEESVAQFYEDVLLEDLKRSPETQNKLGIEHKFKDIYQEAKDTEQLKDYKRRLDHYGISVIADKSLGKSEDPETVRKKINILS